MAAVRSFLDYLHTSDVLTDVSLRSELRPPRAPRPRPRVLSSEELQALLDAPAKQDSPRSLRDAAVLALLYATGLRAAEVVGLKVDDVDLDRGWVERPGHPDPPLPLGRALKPMRRYVVDGRPHLTRRPDERALFLNQRGDRLSRQGLWLVVKRWTARLAETRSFAAPYAGPPSSAGRAEPARSSTGARADERQRHARAPATGRPGAGETLSPEFLSLEEIEQAAAAIRGRTDLRPRLGMILGSGLGPLAESVERATRLEGREIPGWPAASIAGHAGKINLGMLEGQPVMVMQGRAHFYEGYSMPRIGLPVRVMQRLGVEILIVTNAAGAVNQDFAPGDLMLITDHLNLLGMAGQSPLRGPNLEEFGPRFPDMSQAYDRQLQALARQEASASGMVLRDGVYACLAGPSFETPADLRFLRACGVDAVGMSTVPEVTVARHGGTRVLGISGISNKANLDGETLTTHEEVLQAGELIVPKLSGLLRGVIRRL
jgi:purine-nucleoside phosphorylase